MDVSYTGVSRFTAGQIARFFTNWRFVATQHGASLLAPPFPQPRGMISLLAVRTLKHVRCFLGITLSVTQVNMPQCGVSVTLTSTGRPEVPEVGDRLCPDARSAAVGQAGPRRLQGVPAGGLQAVPAGGTGPSRHTVIHTVRHNVAASRPPVWVYHLPLVLPSAGGRWGGSPFWAAWMMLPEHARALLCGRLFPSPLGSRQGVGSRRLRGMEGGQPVREAAAPSDRPGAGGEGARSLTPSPHCRHLPF